MVGCSVGLENLCLDNLDANADGSVVGWGVLVEVLVLLYGFLAVAIIADNHLVTSLETLCVRWNVREDVAGASFMAFGSQKSYPTTLLQYQCVNVVKSWTPAGLVG